MKLYEHEGKALFREHGIAVPEGHLARTAAEAEAAAQALRGGVMLKAQVLSGGRGKAGGVQQAPNAASARQRAEELLGSTIRGLPVDALWVEERVTHHREMYMSFFLDYATEQLWWLFSPNGGVDVEAIPAADVLRVPVSLRSGPEWSALTPFLVAHGLAKLAEAVHRLADSLYGCVRAYDLLLAEINPLFVTAEGRLVAADARVEIDDNALFRHPAVASDAKTTQRNKSDAELRAESLGLNGFVELEGEVGILASGAGLGMASMDLLQEVGLRPANFLETGGRITADLVHGALDLVLDQPGLRAVLVNLYGGINPMVEAARGLVACVTQRRPGIPIVVKLSGNEQEEAWALLEAAHIPTVRSIETETAVEKLTSLLRGTT